jgi:ABC-type Fe3+-citrate transport system substrate-binding protein
MPEPQRIVSLVPSDTYTLVRLGAGGRLVGRTEYCVAPAEAVAAVPTVGGTKNADVEAIVALEPDLVVANREENRKVDIERLEQAGIRVLLSFPTSVRDGLDHASALAALFPSIDNRAVLAEADTIWRRHAQRMAEPVAVFVPIWMEPLMTANQDTFISDVVELVGGRNVFADRARRYPLGADLGRRPAVPPGERDTRYPRVTLDEVVGRAPRLILLPDEPHPFGEADAAVFRSLPIDAAVRFCDGKDLMWYGLRALEGLDRLAAVLAMYY